MTRELTNSAVEHQRRWAELLNDDRDIQTALATYADGATLTMYDEDGLVVRKDQAEDWFEDILNTPETIDWSMDVVAVRGDVLCLTRHHTRRSGSGFESDRLYVLEIDADGLAIRAARFQDEDLKEANDCLNQWWVEGLAPELTGIGSVAVKLLLAIHDGDRSALSELLDVNSVVIDHRPLSFGQMDKQATIEMWLTRQEESPGFVMLTPTIERLTPTAILSTSTVVSPNGFVTSGVAVQTFEDGLLTRMDLFEEHHLDRALARFDELTTQSP